MIPRGEAEFRRCLWEESPMTRGVGSDDTEEMETEAPRELEMDKETSVVETPEDRDVPEEPEVWDSGSERGDWDSEHDEGEEGQGPGDEERMKTTGVQGRPEPPAKLPSSISPRLCDILAR